MLHYASKERFYNLQRYDCVLVELLYSSLELAVQIFGPGHYDIEMKSIIEATRDGKFLSILEYHFFAFIVQSGGTTL